ncbi:uncharacterized protein LOC124492646 isoform X1 [Dermatophagoides farinae]|uniref:uncharacterized protein LOC124492646 isoform X1 n=1 Tax=Dermatophagoides farinae TaxID=6954 RepID=UPI001F0DE521|nr:uncharacterized protein LOC124492646 isoform X1 [Dermatophagoides farinae]
MNLIPSKQNFCTNYLYLTEKSLRDDDFQRNLLFKLSLSKLDSNKENVLIKFLLKFFRFRAKNHRKSYYFKNSTQFLRFFTGIVHYCPKIILDQLVDSNVAKRYHIVLLLKSVISLLILKNYSINIIFLSKINQSSEFSHFILESFLNCFSDEHHSIRRLFIEISQLMLNCSSELLDSSIHKSLNERICHLCINDHEKELRLLSLDVLEKLAHCRPEIYCKKTFETLIFLCLNKDQKDKLRIMVEEKLSTIYIDLTLHYPRNIFKIPNLGKIVGALLVRYNQIENKQNNMFEKRYLYNLLLTIRLFLEQISNEPG